MRGNIFTRFRTYAEIAMIFGAVVGVTDPISAKDSANIRNSLTLGNGIENRINAELSKDLPRGFPLNTVFIYLENTVSPFATSDSAELGFKNQFSLGWLNSVNTFSYVFKDKSGHESTWDFRYNMDASLLLNLFNISWNQGTTDRKVITMNIPRICIWDIENTLSATYGQYSKDGQWILSLDEELSYSSSGYKSAVSIKPSMTTVNPRIVEVVINTSTLVEGDTYDLSFSTNNVIEESMTSSIPRIWAGFEQDGVTYSGFIDAYVSMPPNAPSSISWVGISGNITSKYFLASGNYRTDTEKAFVKASIVDGKNKISASVSMAGGEFIDPTLTLTTGKDSLEASLSISGEEAKLEISYSF